MINIYLNQMAMIGDMDVKHNIVLTILSSGSILHETFFFFFQDQGKLTFAMTSSDLTFVK